MMSIDVRERSVVRVEEDVERHVVVATVVHRRRRNVGYVVERVQIVRQQVAEHHHPRLAQRHHHLDLPVAGIDDRREAAQVGLGQAGGVEEIGRASCRERV